MTSTNGQHGSVALGSKTSPSKFWEAVGMVRERMQSERGSPAATVPDARAEPEADGIQLKVAAANRAQGAEAAPAGTSAPA